MEVKGLRPLRKKTGRDHSLVQQRNERLCARVYYLRTLCQLRNEELLAQLQAEFDIAVGTIPQILQKKACQEMFRKLRDQKPQRRYFRQKWPGVVW